MKRAASWPAENQRIGDELPIPSIRTVRFTDLVPVIAVGKQGSLRKLVEGIDEELNDEDQKKNSGNLKKTAEIDTVAETRPEESHHNSSYHTQDRSDQHRAGRHLEHQRTQ